MRFKLFSRRTLFGKRWYFHGQDEGNGEIVCQSEGYRRHRDARNAVELIMNEAANAEIDDSEYVRSKK